MMPTMIYADETETNHFHDFSASHPATAPITTKMSNDVRLMSPPFADFIYQYTLTVHNIKASDYSGASSIVFKDFPAFLSFTRPPGIRASRFGAYFALSISLRANAVPG